MSKAGSSMDIVSGECRPSQFGPPPIAQPLRCLGIRYHLR